MEREYALYAVEQTQQLLAIDSPSGFTAAAAQWVLNAFSNLGYSAHITRKGGVLCCLNPDAAEDGALLLEAHVDTLGGMVTQVTGTGRLKLTNLGGMNPNNAEAENVRIYTRDGKVYTGAFQLCNASNPRQRRLQRRQAQLCRHGGGHRRGGPFRRGRCRPRHRGR